MLDFNIDNINFMSKIQKNYSLQKKHQFKKRAGNAKYYYQLNFDNSLDNDLKTLSEIYNANLPFLIFGLHTNLYITENGYEGLFVDISPMNSTIKFNEKDETFIVTSNTTVSKLVNFTMEKGYNFAALTGVPGMVGSGIVGNSGWTPSGRFFSDFVQRITVFNFETDQYEEIVPANTFFESRDSFIKKQNRIKTKYFVKEVVLKSEYIGENKVREIFKEQMEKRQKSLKISFQEGNAGSFFSNAHLKKEIGKTLPTMIRENLSINADYNGARFSEGNLLFITQSQTTDKDVAKLFVHTIQKVKELYNVELHKEVIILDSDGEIDLQTFLKRY